jgi:hypothetical protein
MKKTILSMAMLFASSAAFSQAFTNGNTGFTQSLGTGGTSCLSAFTNGGYQWADGNVASASNNANEFTITAVAVPSGTPATSGFDFYYTGAGCDPMRTTSIGVDMSGAGNAKMRVRAKASVAGATVQFHVLSSLNAYPQNTTANLGVPTSQTQVTLTTSYADYTIDFSGSAWDAGSASFRQTINTWGVIIPSDNPTFNNGVVINIESIKVGSDVINSNSSANVVNEQVNLFPNPAKSSFNVDITAMQVESALVKVMNANGTVVKELTASDVTTVSTEGLVKGIYLVQVTSGNKVANKKVVVE